MLLALLAAAPAWDATFDASATASYLDRPNAAVLVVAGGEPSESRAAAERALVEALRKSGQTRLVMSGESLAATPGDSDEALVKKAAVLPVDVVLVLRLFPGATETAVATFYDKAGAALSALSGSPGQPLARREGGSRQNAGRAAVVETVKKAEGAQGRTSGTSSGGVGHDPGKIEFGGGAMVNARTGQVLSTWIIPFHKGERLEGAHFYEVVGREDLARQYRSRATTRTGLLLGGGVATAAGTVMALATMLPTCAIWDARAQTCLQTRVPNLVVPGLVMAGAGFVALMVGAFFQPDPVSPKARYELAEEYNRGVDARRAGAASREVERPRVTLGVAPTPGGVSAALSLTF